MRMSELFLSTLREVPAEAETISHQLMLRAGIIRKLAAAQRNREESSQERPEPMPVDADGFMNIPEDFDEELPFA